MRKNIFIAALLLISVSLSGCGAFRKLKPSCDASIGDKVENDDVVMGDTSLAAVISATNTSATVKIVNNTDSTWQSGNMRDYSLEALKDGEWYKVNQVGEFANTMELMIFSPGQTLNHTFEFAERYGKLSKGEYRIVKSFWANKTESADAHEFKLVCEFTVE